MGHQTPSSRLHLYLQLLLWYELNIHCLLTLVTTANFVSYELTLIQSLEALLDESGLVHKNLLAVLGDNKSVSLFRVEPFNFSVHIIYKVVRFVLQI